MDDIYILIENILLKSDLPESISFKNKNVLKLEKMQKHYSLSFMNKLLFRIINNTSKCSLELRPEYKDIIDYDNKIILLNKWIILTNLVNIIKIYKTIYLIVKTLYY